MPDNNTPEAILALVDRFHRNEDAYRSSHYNEAQTRQEFINPFFKCLGWDMENEQGYAEAYKDVIHEASLKIGGATKAPDYCFRIGGARKFFLEAKKPAINVKVDTDPAYQLRRYSWSAKLPLSVLTNFEEFAVYDCRIKPVHGDAASVARTMYFTYRDYASKWDDIFGIFSRDAVLKGSFDTYAEATKRKKGTATVDTAFLEEIESWRATLANNLALRNHHLSQRELNYAVQVTIDRIVFLRMCEDRGVETYGQLQALLAETGIYKEMLALFHKADDRYNSGLFHFHKEPDRTEIPDNLTPALTIDDAVLADIIRGLYYPESPYEFSVLPAEILGQVYEQFLGKVIRLTSGHHAKVEDKPEVKKSGGIYYTPTYIVDYIVKHTIGKLLEGKTPKQVAKMCVLDPACGSGSFLLGAYSYLLEWHRDWYVADTSATHPKEVYERGAGDWRLTTGEKKRILLNNVYGVDIDPQAVEVTKLSLLLKVLEGESHDTLESQRLLFHERALPDLANNIKCGNSLIAPDFYEGQQLSMFDDDEHYRINVFDWSATFPRIMKAGRFDAVIGNPPYIRIQRIAHGDADYVFRKYKWPTSKIDLSLVFLEKALALSAKAGYVGFICTSQWMTTKYGRNIRKSLSDGRVHEIVDFGSLPVFQGADTYPAIFVLSPTPQKALQFKRISKADELNLDAIEASPAIAIPKESLSEEPWNLGRLDILQVLTDRSLRFVPLRDFGKAYIGTKSGKIEAFVVSVEDAKRLDLENDLLYPYAHRGGEVERYCKIHPGAVVIYPYREGENGDPQLIPEAELKAGFPNIHAHLLQFKSILRLRMDSRHLYANGPDWYRHLRPGSYRYIHPPKFALKGVAKRCCVGLLSKETAFDGARCPAVIIEDLRGHDLMYFLALLNSRLASYHLRTVCPPKLSGYVEFSATCLTNLPIRLMDLGKKNERAVHDGLAERADQMLSLHSRLSTARTPHERLAIQAQIDATDHQIDHLVYQAYGLTQREIDLVDIVAE